MRARQRGSVMSEYVIVTLLLSLMVFYGLVGGNFAGTDADKSTGEDLNRLAVDGKGPAPGLSQALQKRGDDFTNQIYQP
jgi:hypothetical protein